MNTLGGLFAVEMAPIWRHFIWPLSLPVPDSSPTGFVARGRSRHGHFRGQTGGGGRGSKDGWVGRFLVFVEFVVVADALLGRELFEKIWEEQMHITWRCPWKDSFLVSSYSWTSQGPNFQLDLFSQKVPWNHLPVMILPPDPNVRFSHAPA